MAIFQSNKGFYSKQHKNTDFDCSLSSIDTDNTSSDMVEIKPEKMGVTAQGYMHNMFWGI
jgi:uncharacterized protein (DUF2141 family)